MFLTHSFRSLMSSLGYPSKKSWPVSGCSRTLSARIAILTDLIIYRCLQLNMDTHGCVIVYTACSNHPLPTHVKCYTGEGLCGVCSPSSFLSSDYVHPEGSTAISVHHLAGYSTSNVAGVQ